MNSDFEDMLDYEDRSYSKAREQDIKFWKSSSCQSTLISKRLTPNVKENFALLTLWSCLNTAF